MSIYDYKEVSNRIFDDSDSDEDIERALKQRVIFGVKKKTTSRAHVPSRKPRKTSSSTIDSDMDSDFDLDGEVEGIVIPKQKEDKALSAVERAKILVKSTKDFIPTMSSEAVTSGIIAIPKDIDMHKLLEKTRGLQQQVQSLSSKERDLTKDFERQQIINIPAYAIPIIKRAQPRMLNIQSDINIDLINGILGVVTGASVSENTTNPKDGVLNISSKIRIRTRLGSHEWNWQVDELSKFDKLRSKFAEVYGLLDVDVTFTFDGDAIGNDSTPQDLELEDDYLIDVKVREDKIAHAIECAEKFKVNPAVVLTVPASSAADKIHQEQLTRIPCDVLVIIPGALSDTEEVRSISLKLFRDFKLRQIHTAIKRFVRFSAFSLYRQSDDEEIILSLTIADAGFGESDALVVGPSPTINIIVHVGDNHIPVKVPRHQAIGNMMTRVTEMLSLTRDQLSFTYEGIVLAEDNLYCDFSIIEGAIIEMAYTSHKN